MTAVHRCGTDDNIGSLRLNAGGTATAHRLLVGADGVAIGFLATVSPDSTPHMTPVYPIFCGDELYLSAGGHRRKVNDLLANGAYVLHAFLRANDEPLQIAGRAEEIVSEHE